jgi:hypothetical protein
MTLSRPAVPFISYMSRGADGTARWCRVCAAGILAPDPLGADVPTGDSTIGIEHEDPVVISAVDKQPQPFLARQQFPLPRRADRNHTRRADNQHQAQDDAGTSVRLVSEGRTSPHQGDRDYGHDRHSHRQDRDLPASRIRLWAQHSERRTLLAPVNLIDLDRSPRGQGVRLPSSTLLAAVVQPMTMMCSTSSTTATNWGVPPLP